MRVIRDDPNKGRGKPRVTLADIKDTFSNWKVYGHCLSAFLTMYELPRLPLP